jgi:hypothetical protein
MHFDAIGAERVCRAAQIVISSFESCRQWPDRHERVHDVRVIAAQQFVLDNLVPLIMQTIGPAMARAGIAGISTVSGSAVPGDSCTSVLELARWISMSCRWECLPNSISRLHTEEKVALPILDAKAAKYARKRVGAWSRSLQFLPAWEIMSLQARLAQERNFALAPFVRDGNAPAFIYSAEGVSLAESSADTVDEHLDEVEAAIFQDLGRAYPELLKIKQLKAVETWTDKTVKKSVQRLIARGHVHRPKGIKAGCQFTPSGRQLAARLRRP